MISCGGIMATKVLNWEEGIFMEYQRRETTCGHGLLSILGIKITAGPPLSQPLPSHKVVGAGLYLLISGISQMC